MLRDDRSHIDEVLGQIRDAFGATPRPADQDLLCRPLTNRSPDDPVHDAEIQGAEALRAALAGKAWPDLERAWLEEHWASFCYLSPEGHRHFLPALLTTALTKGASDSYRHAVAFSLQPDWWTLYWGKGPPGSDALLDLCPPTEQRAVAAWLGLVFDLDDACDWLAGQSLFWVWNREDTEDLRRARAHYVHMRGWTRPGATGDAGALIVAIEEAFADVPPPTADAMVDSRMDDEPAEYGMEFRGADWRRLHPDFLSRHYASLSFFTDAAFHYFLPAYLIADLLGSPGNANPQFHLEDDRRPGVDFTAGQCKAIVRYLRWSVAQWDMEMPEVDRAIETYWLQRCETDRDR